jgi:FkbM family methyltransferase
MSLANAVEINADGWLWPKGDVHCYPTVKHELAEIPELLSFCSNRRTCVQAGGNGGLWVDELAKEFQSVITFEPDSINFRCLVHNVARDNVVFMRAALGSVAKTVGVDRWCGERNVGAHRIGEGGIVPTIRLDDMNLQDVDLLQLDIEGFELFALNGAEQTIARCKPVISVELRNHAGFYGYSAIGKRWCATSMNSGCRHERYHAGGRSGVSV